MNFKIFNIYNTLLLFSCFILTSKTLALTNDNQQPIYISSMKQTINMITNTVTFIDDVVVKRGSINICLDKIVITRPNNKNGNEIMEGYGNPVTFYQLQDDGKSVRGHSLKIRYETANNLIVLIGNAYIEQLDSSMKGDRITYLMKTQQIEAFSDKGKYVTTVLMPAQFLDKNNSKQTN